MERCVKQDLKVIVSVNTISWQITCEEDGVSEYTAVLNIVSLIA